MMKRYNVIWIDDEWEKQKSFIEFCNVKHKIDITPFKNSKEGMHELENNISKWDAVILDAKVYDKSDDEIASLKGLMSSIKRIESLKSKKKVPYFISTGQPDLLSDSNFKELHGKFYSKETDDEELIDDLKIAADNQIETQIRHKYIELFSWFPLQNDLLNILKYIETDSVYDVSCLNNIRKMIEWVRNLCFERGLLPSEVSELNSFSRFLCLDIMREFVPLYVQRSLHSCVIISQEGSHLLSIDEAIKNGDAPYLIKSTVFELLNIIYWCKSLPVDENDIKELSNKTTEIFYSNKNTEKIIHEGIVKQDNNGNYFSGEFLLEYRKMNEEYIGKEIKIFKSVINNNNYTKDIYPHFAADYNIEN